VILGSRRTEGAVLLEVGRPLELMELAIPELKPGQVLVQVAFSGVCQSQLREVRGERGPDRYLPHTLGHEGSGTVIEAAGGVKKVKPGDRVVLSWIRGSGWDVGGTVYQGPGGPVNSGAISTFMRHTVTCENRVTPVPHGTPLREAALLGCAIPTGAGIVFNTMGVRPGSSLAVFGLGGVGLSAVMAAALIGATPIIAVDVLEHRLIHAEKTGATHLINAIQRDPLEAIAELTDGRGVDYAIEAAGRRETMELAFRAVRDNGGLLVIAGNLAHGETISLNPFDLIKGKRIMGTWGGECQPDRDIPMYARLYLSGRLPLDAMTGDTYPLSEINRALTDLAQGTVIRAMVDMAA
jgi:S-(hydroxymethyl)glutathione dehydrogenase/alcohol dehydrogenase